MDLMNAGIRFKSLCIPPFNTWWSDQKLLALNHNYERRGTDLKVKCPTTQTLLMSNYSTSGGMGLGWGCTHIIPFPRSGGLHITASDMYGVSIL